MNQQAKNQIAITEILLKTLEHKDRKIRRNAAEVLRQVIHVSSEIVPSLIKLMENEDWNLRYYATKLLCSAIVAFPKTAETITPVFIKALEDENEHVRIAAVNALGEAGKASQKIAGIVLPYISTALEDKDEFVRQASIKAIAEILKSTFTTYSKK